MALTVRVRNFQSIEDATVVIDGFTVVTGSNNSGKTALQRAIRGVFTNPPAGALVRHGAKYLSVTITFPDGQTVTWEKGTKVNRYIINGGKPLEGLGKGGVPEEVLAMGVRPIKAGNEKIWPQIAEQFVGQVFLLDRSGSMLAEAVADVEKVGQFSAALKLADRDRRKALSALTVRRKDEKSLQVEVDGYAGLAGVDSQVSAVETLLAEAGSTDLEGRQLRGLRDQLTNAQGEVDALVGITDVVVPPASLTQEAIQTGTDAQDYGNLLQQITRAQERVAGLTGIQQVQVPALSLVQGARQSRSEAQTLLGVQDKMRRLQGAITVWEAMVEAAQGTSFEANEAAVKVQEALSFYTQLREDMVASRAAIESLEQQMAAQQEALSIAGVTVSSVLTEMGACPTCHQRTGEPHTHTEPS